MSRDTLPSGCWLNGEQADRGGGLVRTSPDASQHHADQLAIVPGGKLQAGLVLRLVEDASVKQRQREGVQRQGARAQVE
jgi:hypothetical protein